MSTEPFEVKPLDADIVCVGFGPAVGGFLTTLTRALATPEGMAISSRAMPEMPPQILCYERADDIAFGVSGVVTRGRAIRASFPELNGGRDPHGCPRRRREDRLPARSMRRLAPAGPDATGRQGCSKPAAGCSACREHAWELPFCPPFLHKKDGFIFSLGQFNQWVGQQVMMSGLAQIWPSTPVADPIIEDGKVAGVGARRNPDGFPGARRPHRGGRRTGGPGRPAPG